jgi:3-deoxy-7-phosphoheptulonate synthase
MQGLEDIRIGAIRALISPQLLLEKLPASPAAQSVVGRARSEIASILHGQDDRLLCVVGPCSIHDHAQAVRDRRPKH